MAYTEAEIAEVKQAIHDLTTGNRATMVTKDGRTVQYQRTSLPELRAQLRIMLAENQAAAGSRRTRTRYAVTNKGL